MDLNRSATGNLVLMYVDRILRGGQITELPCQQPTRFELIVNLKTVNSLGLTIVSSILARANEVIK